MLYPRNLARPATTTMSDTICPNCNCSIAENENFCSICGQKKYLRPRSIKELLQHAASEALALDSKLFRTMGSLIFRPGKLSNDFFEGRQQRYYTPVKFFLFWITILFLAINAYVSLQPTESNLRYFSYNIKQKLAPIAVDSHQIAAINAAINEELEKRELGSMPGNLGTGDTIIRGEDLYNLSTEEIFEKYEIKGFWKQLTTGQLIKAIKELDNFSVYLLGRLSWILLCSLPMLALFLKLLYVRRKRYYVEHLIFLLHLHCFMSLLALLYLLGMVLQEAYHISYLLSALALLTIYTLLSIRRFYQQSWKKTIFKGLLFMFFYPIINLFAFAIFLVLGFLLF